MFTNSVEFPPSSSALNLIIPQLSPSAGEPLSLFKTNFGPLLASASVDASVSVSELSVTDIVLADVAVSPPVILIFPVPVILFEFKSKSPPS